MFLKKDFSLNQLNTLGLTSTAKYFCTLKSNADILELIENQKKINLPVKILSGGSNLVLSQKIHAIVAKVELRGKKILKEDNEYVYVSCSAGENWHQFVQWCLDHNLFGLENLSLIPGLVGAAPIQNIGAYGVEVKDVITQVKVIDLFTGEEKVLANSECQFAYRDSYFKQMSAQNLLITEVEFKLNQTLKPKLSYGDVKSYLESHNYEVTGKNISKAIIHIRSSKLPDPAVIGNAGSFFKNPIVDLKKLNELKTQFPQIVHYSFEGKYKLAAGWLIDQCHWKGKSLGSVGMYEKQALVLVKVTSAANSDDVWNLVRAVQQDVLEKFNVLLEPEPIFW